MNKLNDIQKIALDLYKGNMPANFSTREAEDVLRDTISELICVNGKPNHNKYGENKYKVFALLEEIFLPVVEPYRLPQELANMIRIESIGDGESKEFEVEYPELFDIYKVSDGNIDVRRQTVAGRKISIPTEFAIVRIYAELSDFLAGRVDWVGMVNRVNRSFEDQIARNMAGLFGEVANPIHTANGTFDSDTLADLIDRVEEKYGTGTVIYGKKSALGKVQDVVQAERSKEDFNAIGYYGQFRGTPMVEIPVKGNDLVILPYNGSPIGVVLFEGNPLFLETADFGARNDLQLEFVMRRKIGYAKVDVSGAVYELA